MMREEKRDGFLGKRAGGKALPALFLILCLLTAVLWQTPFASLAKAKSSDVKEEQDSEEGAGDRLKRQVAMEADYGFGKKAKAGRYLPIQVTYKNQEKQAFQEHFKF